MAAFMPLMLEPVDFVQLYRQRMEAAQPSAMPAAQSKLT